MVVFTEVFNLIESKDIVFGEASLAKPHGFKIRPLENKKHEFVLYLILEGNLDIDSLKLSAGDILLLVKDKVQILKTCPEAEIVDLYDFLGTEEVLTNHKIELGDLKAGGAKLFWGCFNFKQSKLNPLLSSLPERVLIKAEKIKGRETKIKNLITMMQEEFNAQVCGSDLIIEKLSTILLIEIIRIYISTLDVCDNNWLKAVSDPVCSQAIKFIHENYDTEINIDELARSLGFSRSSFYTHFKTKTGESPYQYVKKWKMLKACEYLSSSDLSVVAISNKLKYQSESSFSYSFKQTLGVSPSEYRKQSKNHSG